MDLASFKPKADTVTVELVTPTGEPLLNPDNTPMTITAYHSYSKQYRAVQDEIADRRMQVAFKERSKGKKKQSDTSVPTMAEIRDNALELAARTTVEWNITLNKKKPDCNEEEARKLYSDLPFVLDQVQDEVNGYTEHLGNS